MKKFSDLFDWEEDDFLEAFGVSIFDPKDVVRQKVTALAKEWDLDVKEAIECVEREIGDLHEIQWRESDYFDFSLPGEQKYITEVTLMVDDIKSGETWTVSLESDDGSFASIATFTSGSTQKHILSSPVSAFRFRYKIEYATTQTQSSPSKVKGILFRALSGEMVPYWQLTIDGTETRNVENRIVRPKDVYDDLKTLRADKTPVTFIDRYESDSRSDATTYTVRVQGVTIIKEEPKESQIQVVLVGV